MKHFPFKILIIGIILPPLCYILTIQILETYFQKHGESRLNQLLIQNHDALYEGRYTVKEEINRNIGEYLSQSLMLELGVRLRILVKTKDDRILYPSQLTMDHKGFQEADDFSELPLETLNYVEVGAENYKILNEGLALSVDVKVRHNSWLSNSILVLYVVIMAMIVQRFIKKGIRATEREKTEHKRLILRLSEQLDQTETRLKEVKANETNYLKRINELKKDRTALSKDIDALLEEMEKLEAGLETQKGLKEKMEYEALELREDLGRLKGKIQKSKKKKKRNEVTNKRFKVLYKNLMFTDRAIEGFLSLTDEFQLKAEEVIHMLNEDESLISVKRKVFGKGGKMNILEVDFSYSGRIYFQKDAQSKTTIVTIGTKNTQDHDLAYLESVS